MCDFPFCACPRPCSLCIVVMQLVSAETAMFDLKREIASLRDETAVKELDGELQRTRAELESCEQLKDELAALLEEV